eukprot:NODE_569_length_2095_cov_24.504399_g525_i0.p1 GENE.NODE_569_length_2095_cov_24.504399_g525_i0~~NODE_569_length_2095_cov_24.504399_g525_i0.p1  ORF type:complete len:313 (-),score=67.33 NODE_569_length_2095_cov_24.504399_g525_i0:93-1031(-)
MKEASADIRAAAARYGEEDDSPTDEEALDASVIKRKSINFRLSVIIDSWLKHQSQSLSVITGRHCSPDVSPATSARFADCTKAEVAAASAAATTLGSLLAEVARAAALDGESARWKRKLAKQQLFDTAADTIAQKLRSWLQRIQQPFSPKDVEEYYKQLVSEQTKRTGVQSLPETTAHRCQRELQSALQHHQQLARASILSLCSDSAGQLEQRADITAEAVAAETASLRRVIGQWQLAETETEELLHSAFIRRVSSLSLARRSSLKNSHGVSGSSQLQHQHQVQHKTTPGADPRELLDLRAQKSASKCCVVS